MLPLKNANLNNSPEDLDISERSDRLKKLNLLREAGINPYPAKVERDYEIAAVLADFEKLAAAQKTFHIVGRLRSKREHGNLAFASYSKPADLSVLQRDINFIGSV